MNLGSPLAIAFWIGAAVIAGIEVRHQMQERAWRREQDIALRARNRFVSGLSDAVLCAIPDDELSDAELERKVAAEARWVAEFSAARAEIRALPETAPRRRFV